MIQRFRLGSTEAIDLDMGSGNFLPNLAHRDQALADCRIHLNSYLQDVADDEQFAPAMEGLGLVWKFPDNDRAKYRGLIHLLEPAIIIGDPERVVSLGKSLVRIGYRYSGHEAVEFRDLTNTLRPGFHAVH